MEEAMKVAVKQSRMPVAREGTGESAVKDISLPDIFVKKLLALLYPQTLSGLSYLPDFYGLYDESD
ncbi:hypothetical protein PanWU01x14_229990 [Parasponia andersonii]|uniref:Uncharacterized protein n=1 Tax=Parasponia andersonii TaxID=3476 RepID=A0A2P5BKV7_PARAD|nr:hypothetical protein PanWU01x14_229990 [Parasponia andersonii]